MENPLTEKDLNLLNAYLDDELTVAERLELEERLDLEPPLVDTLEQLRATVGILRLTEQIPVPRNFTLDPAVYAKPQKGNWLFKLGLSPIMPLVTSGAALLAIFSLGGSILLGVPLRGSAEPQLAEVAMNEAADETEEMSAPSAFSADGAFAPPEEVESTALAVSTQSVDDQADTELADEDATRSEADDTANALPAEGVEDEAGALAVESAVTEPESTILPEPGPLPEEPGQQAIDNTEVPSQAPSVQMLLQLSFVLFGIVALIGLVGIISSRRKLLG